MNYILPALLFIALIACVTYVCVEWDKYDGDRS